MTYIERKRYVIIVSAAFLVGFALSSLLTGLGDVFYKHPAIAVPVLRSLVNTLQSGLIGGYCVASAVAASCWFILSSEKRNGLKLLRLFCLWSF